MNSESITISVVVITFNEENNLKRCLESVEGIADEVIVVDSFSTDGTLEIAASFNAIVHSRAWKGYSEQKNWANEQATCDFILSLDADEAFSDELRSSILAVKQQPKSEGYQIKRLTNFCGTWIKHAGWYPDKKVRLWKRGFTRWNDNVVHEEPIIPKDFKPLELNGDLLHYSFSSLAQHISTVNQFARLKAQQFFEQGNRPTLVGTVFKAIFTFIKIYIFQLGLLHGYHGFVIAYHSSLKYFLRFGHYRKIQSAHLKQVCFMNTTKFWGGGEKWHAASATLMVDEGFPVKLICRKNGKLDQKVVSSEVSKIYLSSRNLSFLNPFKVWQLMMQFRKEKVHTVIFNSSPDMKLGGIAAFLAGVPRIVYRRGTALPAKGNLINLMLITALVDELLVNSRATLLEFVSKLKLPLHMLKTTIIHNGIDTTLYYNNGENHNVLRLGIAARLVKQKGIDYLLKIAHHLQETHPSFELSIAGSGPLESELRKKVEDFRLNNQVKFLGFVEDIPGFMAGLDIYLCTSRYEGFGYSIAEAMASSLPVVAFHISSNPELVVHEETGFLVAPFETEAFAHQVKILMEDALMVQSMGRAGRSRAVDCFDQRVQNRKFLTFLQSGYVQK